MKTPIAISAFTAVLLSIHPAPAQSPTPPRPVAKPPAASRTQLPADVLGALESHRDLTYATYGDRQLQLDLFRPKHAGGNPLPAIVCIHGGGWAKGNRQNHANLAQALAHRGYVTVTISYRLSGEAAFPAQIHDCKAAVRWLRANAERYGVNPDRIGAAGLSAGGHLAALLATSGGVADLEGDGGNPGQPSAIQAAVPMGAQTDFMSERSRVISKTREIWKAFLGGSQAERPQTYRLASPLTHLDAGDPPTLFLSGELDDPSTHAAKFRARMTQLGIPNGYITIPEAPHGFMNRQKDFDFCIEHTAAFFDKHLAATSAAE